MAVFQLYVEELLKSGDVWVTEDLTGEFMMYLGTETDVNYLISYDTKQQMKKVQFSLH